MNEETVDLRSLGARKNAQTSARVARALAKREEVPIRLSASRSEDATLRTLASLPPEALQGEGEITEAQLLEYAEALRFSARKKKNIQETRMALASVPDEASAPIPTTPTTPIRNKEASSQELVRELARIEKEDEALEQSMGILKKEQEGEEVFPRTEPQESEPGSATPAFYQEQSYERASVKLANMSFSPSRGGALHEELRTRRRGFLNRTFFILLAVVVCVPLSGLGVLATRGGAIQNDALADAYEAYEHMERGKEALMALDHATAQIEFEQAYSAFDEAEGAAGLFSRATLRASTALPFTTKVSSAARMLEAGKRYAQAGTEVSLALAQVRSTQDSSQDAIAATDAIIEATNHLDRARVHFEYANTVLAYVRPTDLPKEFSDDFALIQQQTHQVELLLNEAYTSLPAVLSMLGHDESKRYLFLFQNNTELRATGGFIGTYGTLVMEDGVMRDLLINGIYDPDGQLQEKIVPPTPLQRVTPNWGTRDSNWFFDFPTSARKAMDFFEKTGNGEVDGVIALTPFVVQELLRISGPVEMSSYGVTVTSENFLEIVQEEVEENYDKELNRPKQILTDMAPILIERALSGEHQGALLSVLIAGLQQKDIMAYTAEGDTQSFLVKRGWGGAITSPEVSQETIGDYLSVVLTNIGGAKTDRYTTTSVDTTTRVEGDGSIIRTVWISRKHTGGNTSYWWYDRANTSYVRVYTPQGAEFIDGSGFSASPALIKTDYAKEGYERDTDLARVEATMRTHEESGVDVFEETGRTVFGNWMVLKPGEERVAHITYRLPASVVQSSKEYTLLLQKQPGVDVAYSGAFESAPSAPSFAGCQQDKETLTMPRFRFTQTTDVIISCALRR